MKQITMVRGGVFLLALTLMCSIALTPALANEGEDHHEESTESSTTDIARMEQMITLMKQLIALLTTLKGMQPVTSAPMPAVSDDSVEEMEVHHDEHAHEDAASDEAEDTHDEHEDEAQLIIEIEPHNGQTHAHVRYVDKAEEMFFIDVDIEDEDGIVSAISSRTGLDEDEVRDALEYMQ